MIATLSRPQQRQEAQAEKRADLLAKLEAGVKDLRGSDQYQAFLDHASRFHSYSFANVMLISLQYPGASRVAGYRAWQSMGRQVRKGEKGIAIMAPRPYKEHADGCSRGQCQCPQGGVGFTTVSVFDISQTDGDPVPELVTPLSGDDGEMLTALVDVATAEGLSVDTGLGGRRGAANGYYARSERRIWVDGSLAPRQRARTLAHELGHHFAEHEVNGHCGDEREIIAESVAYVVLGHFGIDAGGYSFGYLTSWDTDDDKHFKAQLGEIQKTASTIIDKLEERCEQ